MNEYVTNLILKNAETTVDPELKKFRDDYREKGIPTLLTESLNCLILMATLKKPVKILEFGTSVGCSGIALLKASENATLYTIERYEKAFYEAKENFEKFRQKILEIAIDDEFESKSKSEFEIILQKEDKISDYVIDNYNSTDNEFFIDLNL